MVDHLSSHFAMKDLGSLHYFLGVEAVRTTSTLKLTQSKSIVSILSRMNMLDCKPCSTPVKMGRKLSLYDGTLLDDPTSYRQIVGALLYLTLTRPDIMYAVQQVCQFMHSPRDTHLQAVKRILRYLKGTINFGISFISTSSSTLTGYVDSDWAGCPDRRRSTMGHCIFLGANPISWSTKKQVTLSQSSTEAEYKALSSATSELLWISYLLHDLGIAPSSPITLYSFSFDPSCCGCLPHQLEGAY